MSSAAAAESRIQEDKALDLLELFGAADRAALYAEMAAAVPTDYPPASADELHAQIRFHALLWTFADPYVAEFFAPVVFCCQSPPPGLLPPAREDEFPPAAGEADPGPATFDLARFRLLLSFVRYSPELPEVRAAPGRFRRFLRACVPIAEEILEDIGLRSSPPIWHGGPPSTAWRRAFAISYLEALLLADCRPVPHFPSNLA